jgi:hypothetical protein
VKVDEPATWIEPVRITRTALSFRNDRVSRHEQELDKRRRERLGLQMNEPLPEDGERAEEV